MRNKSVVNNIENPTIETCFYIPNGTNGLNTQLNALVYAKYISVLGQDGEGAGGRPVKLVRHAWRAIKMPRNYILGIF